MKSFHFQTQYLIRVANKFLAFLKEAFFFPFTYFISLLGWLNFGWNLDKKNRPILLIHGYINSGSVFIYLGRFLKNSKANLS